MKNISNDTIVKALAQPTPGLAAKYLIESGTDTVVRYKAGDRVVILDDEIYGYSGLAVEVVGPSDKGGEFLDVRAANGMVIPVFSTLLAPAGGPSI